MVNTGVEIELRGTPIKTKDLEWNVNLNFTAYKNEVINLPEERKTYEIDGKGGWTSGSFFYGENTPLYTYHLKRYAGVSENGESMWYYNAEDAEGNTIMKTTTNYSDADYYLCGSALPKAYGGFGTSLVWGDFDFSIDFSYQIGGQVYDSDYAGLMSSPTSSSKGTNFHADMLNSWTSGNNSNIPRLQFDDTYSAGTSDRFLTDASYLSLNNINIGYTLPRMLTKKVGIENVRFYAAADNIWVWSQRKGLDPRQSITGSSTNSYYAPIRTISGGVTLTF